MKSPCVHCIYIVVPQIFKSIAASNRSAERFFSCLKRIKTFLKLSMTGSRLRNFVILIIESATVSACALGGRHCSERPPHAPASLQQGSGRRQFTTIRERSERRPLARAWLPGSSVRSQPFRVAPLFSSCLNTTTICFQSESFWRLAAAGRLVHKYLHRIL